MKNQTNRDRTLKPFSAFTLLELSIVLVIIAVITSGILVTRSMILSSQLQTVMTDAGAYTAAVGNFKTAYQALPGDFSGATTLWGTDSNGCPSGGGATGTCNGDSDGKVGVSCGSATGASIANEPFRAWQHLNAAGLISSNLTGVSSSGSFYQKPDENIIKGSIKGSGFSLMWLDDPSSCGNAWGLISGSGAYGNVLAFVGAGPYFTPTLTPEQADSIDRKMDDGFADTGMVRAPGNLAAPNCNAQDGTSHYPYLLTYKNPSCPLLFLTNY